MFTGIIEIVGTVRQVIHNNRQMQIAIDLSTISDGTVLGDSIAVDGVCLTVSRLVGTCATFDVSTETARRSTLAGLKTGDHVNLERAMSANGRFGGHVVQGHVDGIGTIAAIRKEADFATFRFETKPELLEQMVLKGSVAVDGISLTVAAVDKTGFEAALIPTTLAETTWRHSKVGNAVNIETDILVKIIQKQLQTMLGEGKGLTLEKLKEHGF